MTLLDARCACWWAGTVAALSLWVAGGMGFAATSAAGLPTGARGWEAIPGVIRSDGVEEFRLEVDVNGAVTAIWLDGISSYLIAPSSFRATR